MKYIHVSQGKKIKAFRHFVTLVGGRKKLPSTCLLQHFCFFYSEGENEGNRLNRAAKEPTKIVWTKNLKEGVFFPSHINIKKMAECLF